MLLIIILLTFKTTSIKAAGKLFAIRYFVVFLSQETRAGVKETDIFRAELTCRDAAVEKMNLHLSVATFDAEGRQTAMAHSDAVPAVAGTVYKAAATEPAAAASVSFYAVPADGPASDLVSEWPAFKLELSVWNNDTLIDRRTFRVNRWGGTQMIGLRYE